ncbi:energy transducer TonB [Duganella sp. FT80W]|uniref:Energy transducer TonB n=1 Tax=Duganella guangzhouensis TaxID=2666084 RepID=A0A6I2L223_9BURK|nr:M56 family metallopeptidase [Duganella guangzhouensis]MRW91963.1 energy transducer TonB [Duganella guangzhouensis]
MLEPHASSTDIGTIIGASIDAAPGIAALALAAMTCVLLLICALRLPTRRVFGAVIAYTLWAAAPATLLAILLPAAQLAAGIAAHIGAPGQLVFAPLHRVISIAPSPASTPWQSWLLAAWLAGTVAMVARLWRTHASYHAYLGPLSQRHGIHNSACDDHSPAVVGLWRPIIVVPRNFATRYTKQEQQLILAHETIHARRHDPLANATCALLQCLFWFHPLVHYAARRFRLDQELACDAAVMRVHPGRKRCYAEAMLKTQLSTQGALIHCHWQSIHPLKERIMQLNANPPRTLRRWSGRIAIIGSCGLAALAAHADVEPSAASYAIDMRLDASGESATPKLLVKEGVPFAVASEGKGGAWRTEFVLNQAGENTVFLKAIIKHDSQVVSQPGLLVRLGEKAAVTGDDFRLTVAVSRQRD